MIYICQYAETEGFEPSEAFTSHAFQACALDRYATSPMLSRYTKKNV